MNQSLVQDFAQVVPLVNDTGIDVEFCTIQRSVNAYNVDGQLDLTASGFAPLPGYENIQCLSSVPSTARVQATDVKSLEDILSKNYRHVWLAGYYPGILQKDRAAITTPDGFTYLYDVLGVESDSQGYTTRLELELASL